MSLLMEDVLHEIMNTAGSFQQEQGEGMWVGDSPHVKKHSKRTSRTSSKSISKKQIDALWIRTRGLLLSSQCRDH